MVCSGPKARSRSEWRKEVPRGRAKWAGTVGWARNWGSTILEGAVAHVIAGWKYCKGINFVTLDTHNHFKNMLQIGREQLKDVETISFSFFVIFLCENMSRLAEKDDESYL